MWEGEIEWLHSLNSMCVWKEMYCLHQLILHVCLGRGQALIITLCVGKGYREPAQINTTCVYVREGESKCLHSSCVL